jgi:GH24 family phage-related lysozyme (muramidase)
MCRSCFESFIRNGGTKTFVLYLGNRAPLEFKQDASTRADEVRDWVDENWTQSFGATSQAILKTKPFEFSADGLSDLDQETLRVDAAAEVAEAMTREGFTLEDAEGRQRALAVLFGFLNRVQQEAMGIDFYVWTTQNDSRVREGHAERDDKIFRWDDPPEGGHPSEDFGCRCYARPLGIEGYWERVSEGVDTYAPDAPTWEGSIDHMYLDTRGNVTVGVGTRLSNADAAADLAFRHRDTDVLASRAEIRAEYDVIRDLESGEDFAASYYEPFTTLYLPDEEIEPLVYEHMRGDFDALLAVFPYFGNYPQAVQIALWDMSYNLGVGGLKRKFPKFCQAIRDEDWEVAAAESHREGIADERNEFVFNQLREAMVP